MSSDDWSGESILGVMYRVPGVKDAVTARFLGRTASGGQMWIVGDSHEYEGSTPEDAIERFAAHRLQGAEREARELREFMSSIKAATSAPAGAENE